MERKMYRFQAKKKAASKQGYSWMRYMIDGKNLEHAKMRAKKKWGDEVALSTGKQVKKPYPCKRSHPT